MMPLRGACCVPGSSNYKGFPTFVKQNFIVVESRSD